ncbi:MAG: hypothetical protein JOZ46_12255 [Candidatus Dormibacteraeota bacterium]|nr:hypothetical protein [Candidatus Dormibacteraeota bacterium]MBV9526573.1 hypothetical protein [Candidatus Dormibacteraeota bacterium]
MRVRKAAFGAASILVVAGGLALSGPRAAAATVTKCDDTNFPVNGNVTGNLEVPPGAVCHIHGWSISGDVKVDKAAKLFTRDGTSIGGSLFAKNPTQVNIEASTSIGGDFIVDGTAGGAFGGFICGSTVGGDVILKNLKSGTWVIGEPTLAEGVANGETEDYDYSGGGNNDPDLTCESPNMISGDVWVLNSDDVNRVEISYNTIGGSVSVKNVDVVNEFIELESNQIGDELTCRNDEWDMGTPAVNDDFGSEPNIVSETDGQCAGLGGGTTFTTSVR